MDSRFLRLIPTQSDLVELRLQLQNIMNNDKPFPELITQKEAAKLLGKSLVTFWRLRKQHKIPFYRIGNSAMFDIADLRKFLEGQRREQ